MFRVLIIIIYYIILKIINSKKTRLKKVDNQLYFSTSKVDVHVSNYVDKILKV